MNRWVIYGSLAFIVLVVFWPAYYLATDPQAHVRDLFHLGIDLQGGTSMIYELRPPEPGGQSPAAADVKKVIMERIDPQGTSGYTVRAVGAHRLEIVLPGRRTRVSIDAAKATAETVQAAARAAKAQDLAVSAAAIEAGAAALEAGTRLSVRMKPAMHLDDIMLRLSQAVRERIPPKDRPAFAVVGENVPKDRMCEGISVFVAVAADNAEAASQWKRLVTDALATQQDVMRVKRLVGQAGFLEFRIVADKVRDKDKANFDRILRDKQAGKAPDAALAARWRWYPLKKGWELYSTGRYLDEWNYVYVVDEESQTVEVLVDVGDGQDVTGQDMSGAVPDSGSDGDPIVSFRMKPTAGARFARLTSPENRDRHMAIILDGVVQGTPALRATLSSGGIIEGYRGRIRERDEVIRILNSGQLAASLGDPITERTVGPELGADNIAKGYQASLIGFALVVVFMLAYYRFSGLVAVAALILNMVMIICIMFLIRQAWTLPGIAGLILSLAMAVDANVLIYERLREEKGHEGSLSFALKKAYERAFRTILDSNLTTVLPAFVLVFLDLVTEEVKGFAVVMIIGILVSMFTAVLVTRMIFEAGIKHGIVRQLRMFTLFEAPKIDWMKFVRPALVVSGAAAAVGAVLFFTRGDDKYDIEFTGGTQVELALKAPDGQDSVAIDHVRETVAREVGASATVQELEYAHESAEGRLSRFLISVPASGPDSDEKSVKAKLSKAFADMQPDAGRIEAKVDASEITADVLRERLRTQSGAPAAAAATADAPAASYIPAELRQYLGMIRLRVEIDPAMAPGEVNRRVDAFLRDRYPELAVTPYEVRGSGQAGAAGEFASLEVWVAQPYAGARAAVPLSVFWTDAVSGALGGEQDFASTTSFEPTMAAEAWDKAVVAILFSLAAMIVYIWVRFSKLSSGVAAVVALVHDVVITLGAVTAAAMLSDTFLGTTLMLSDFKINLPMVGAFLTLVGYSINDTIVVFDRIRENRGKYGEMSVAVVNNSINQTVSRTVLTSVTVLLAVLALYVFAGRSSSIHGLAFVMLFGTLVGTYSSIAIASPILVLRDYLYRLFVWVYPILGVGLMVYYAFVYETPGEFFGSAVGWVWLVVQLAWVAVATSIVRCDAYGKPWPPAQKSPGLAKALAVVSMAAPLAAVVLVAVMILKPGSSATPWAGPAALGMLATAPVTWALARMAWGSASQKR